MIDTDIDNWIGRIKFAWANDDQSIAESLLEEALKQTGNHPKLLEVAGMIAYLHGQYQQSADLIEQAMFEVVLSISGQMTLANAWLKISNRDRAEMTFEFLVDQIHKVPCNMLPDLNQGVVAIGRHDWAVKVCQEGFRRHPSDHNAIFAIGLHLWKDGDTESGQSYIRQAIAMAPEIAFYRLQFCMLLLDHGEDEAAYAQILTVSPEDFACNICSCHRQQLRELLSHKQDYRRLASLLRVLDSTEDHHEC